VGDFGIFEKITQGDSPNRSYGLRLWRHDLTIEHRPNRFDGWLGFVKHVAVGGVYALQLVTVIGNGCIRVSEHVTCEDANDSFVWLDNARIDQFANAC
jgi:hypothetical protein